MILHCGAWCSSGPMALQGARRSGASTGFERQLSRGVSQVSSRCRQLHAGWTPSMLDAWASKLMCARRGAAAGHRRFSMRGLHSERCVLSAARTSTRRAVGSRLGGPSRARRVRGRNAKRGWLCDRATGAVAVARVARNFSGVHPLRRPGLLLCLHPSAGAVKPSDLKVLAPTLSATGSGFRPLTSASVCKKLVATGGE